ncbi:hypothetical protein [Roseateles sp.]|uniref:hypothetical protein n=1 Tax=Roseateles sp. TaxID=1971397 RepID=UPI0031D3CAD0
MGKKSEARAQKKAEAQARFEASKKALLSKVGEMAAPRRAREPMIDSSPRLAPHLERALANERVPKAREDGARFNARMTWCITRADVTDHWSWGEPRAWTGEEWTDTIHPPMSEFAALTWGEIDRQNSGTGHKMHHTHEIGDLIEEAQTRWRRLELEQYDSVFRFRLGGQKRRAWGFIVQAHFHFVWWDREHSLYPTEPH